MAKKKSDDRATIRCTVNGIKFTAKGDGDEVIGQFKKWLDEKFLPELAKSTTIVGRDPE